MAPARDTIHAPDLSSAIRALGKVDKAAQKEAVQVLREAAIKGQRESQARLTVRPGGGSYPRRRGQYGRFADQKGAGLKLAGAKYPWAWGAEFGAKRAWLPRGQVTLQSKLRRRQFPVWRGSPKVVRGKAGPGWIMYPTIRRLLPEIETDLQKGLADVFERSMRQAGVGNG